MSSFFKNITLYTNFSHKNSTMCHYLEKKSYYLETFLKYSIGKWVRIQNQSNKIIQNTILLANSVFPAFNFNLCTFGKL